MATSVGGAIPWAPLLAAYDFRTCMTSPLTWAFVCGAVWLLMSIPRGVRRRPATTWLAGLLALAAAVLFGAAMPPIGAAGGESAASKLTVDQVVYFAMALAAVGSAAAAISMKSALYAAVWFALSLLGTAGLFLVQGAQFLAVATVVVYAGAIVVTLLFVVMLAQPEGHETYDRISWGWLAKPVSVGGALVLVAVLSMALAAVKNEKIVARVVAEKNPVIQSESHMARLGAELFSRHLVSVEVAGTLLMAALVGAIAIVIQGKESAAPARREAQGHE